MAKKRSFLKKEGKLQILKIAKLQNRLSFAKGKKSKKQYTDRKKFLIKETKRVKKLKR